jgi:hypothetical protein
VLAQNQGGILLLLLVVEISSKLHARDNNVLPRDKGGILLLARFAHGPAPRNRIHELGG